MLMSYSTYQPNCGEPSHRRSGPLSGIICTHLRLGNAVFMTNIQRTSWMNPMKIPTSFSFSKVTAAEYSGSISTEFDSGTVSEFFYRHSASRRRCETHTPTDDKPEINRMFFSISVRFGLDDAQGRFERPQLNRERAYTTKAARVR
jgi:hypothetical protein